VGPYVGGQLLALHWSNQQLFLASALPAILSAVVTAGMHWVGAPKAAARAAAERALAH